MDQLEPRGVNRQGKRREAGVGDVLTNGAHERASPPETTVIRPAVRGDLEPLLALEAAFPGDRLSRRAMRHHLASPKAVCLVAETAGRLLGYALLLHRNDSYWWRLYSLIRAGDAPPGTGQRLLEAALEAARLASAQGVRLEVREDNTNAILLYLRLGFTLFATVDGYYEDGARACRMALPFGDRPPETDDRMPAWTIVCDRKDDFPTLPGNTVTLSTRDYLANRAPENGGGAKKAAAGRRRPAKVLNLARDTSYQARGYYVSLLAEARGEKVLPSVATILALRRRSGYALALPDLEEALNKTARRLAEPPGAGFALRIFLGRPSDPRFKRFALLVFDWFRAPLLEVTIQPGEWWRIKKLGMLSVGDLEPEDSPSLDAAVAAYLGRRWLEPKTRTEPRFTLAVLFDPKDPLPPSDLATLKRFARIAEGMGLGVDLIGKDDLARLAAYDALWIRVTTNIDHYTYRFAQRAEQEGMPVIDDPRSIMRCTNKVFLAENLTAHGLPTPATRIIAGRRDIETAATSLGYPLVLKIPDGSFSRGVKKADDRAALERLAAEMLEESDLILAQAFMPTTFDWRVGVLGREPLFVSQYHMAKKHWQIVRHEPDGKATPGRFTTMSIGQAPAEVIEVAVKAAGLMGSGLYGVDIKETPTGIVVIEVNDNPDLNHDVEDLAEKDQVWRRLAAWFLDRLR